jgi:acetyl esterase/lipase
MRGFLLLALLTLTSFAQGPQRPLPEGIKARRDVVYVKDGTARQMLDVYYPAKADKPVPLVVWIHGGAWAGGTKDRTPALPLLDQGFAVASVTYRFSQHEKFPAQIEDCRAAIRWLRANAKDLNIDPKRIGAWGSSAGGHLVALLGVAADQTKWDKGEHLDQSAGVQAVVNWFGPSNLLTMGAQSGPDSRINHDSPNSPESKLVGGPVQERREAATAASPVTYATKDDAPMLLMHGDRDPVVPHAQSVELEKALKAAGSDAKLVTIPGAGHGDGGFREKETLDAVRQFFRTHLQK